MKAAIYTRVSTEAQEREGTSLDTQLEACQTKARGLGYEVEPKHIYSEVYSGADLQRPQITQAREAIRNGEVNALICHDTSRLARKAVHIAIVAEECDKSKVELIFNTEPLDSSAEGQLIRYVKGYAAEIEREKIAERTIRGKRARALSGKLPAGSHAKLYGYIYINKEGKRIINIDEAHWVEEMFKWIAEEGISTNAIAYRLRDLNVPTPSGKGWWKRDTVLKILKNTSYIGKVYAFTRTYTEPDYRMKPDTKRRKTKVVWLPQSEWILIENANPPIISEALFERAQQRLEENRRMATRNARNQYLLHGHIYCARCGRAYWGSAGIKPRNGKRYEYPFYHCSGRLKKVTPIRCDNRQYNAKRIEAMVWAEIEKELNDPNRILETLEKARKEGNTTTLHRDLETTQIQLKNRDKQKERVWKAFELTGDESTFKREIAKLDSEIKQLADRENHIKSILADSLNDEVTEQEFRQACLTMRENLTELTYEKKRLILRVLQIKVLIDGDHPISLHGTLPKVGSIVNTVSEWHRPVPRPGS